MLIGLTASAATVAGLVMALATAIEMGFLGFSYSCSLRAIRKNACSPVRLLLVSLPPLTLLLAAWLAGVFGEALDPSGLPFVGLISFSLVCLLFLVTQELLIEAAEKSGGELWYVNLWFFLGLLFSILLDCFLRA